MRKKMALTVGVFDCLHEGHVDLLKRMREAGDRVVIILHDDYSTFLNKGRFPVQTLEHRKANLMQSGYVDRIEETYSQNPGRDISYFLGARRADEVVYLRGDDWEDFPGRDVLEERSVEIRFKPYLEGVSTTEIRQQLKKR